MDAMRRLLVAQLLLFCACFSETTTQSQPDGGSTSDAAGSSTSSGEMPTTAEEDSASASTSEGGDASSGAPPICGDAIVGPEEMCDASPGCADDCTLVDYPCNPLNQVGCIAAQTCDRSRGATLNDQRTACFQAGTAGFADACQYNSLPLDLQCGDGFTCVAAGFVPGCDGLTDCCTPFCLLGQACEDPTQQCVTWKEPGMPPGLDEMGVCIRP